MKKKRATIIDLAKACNVSKTTISFAFNNPKRIGRETYNLIMEKAKELDYIPNPAGRNFSLMKKQTIGFLLPQHFEATFNNPYITNVIQGIGNICNNRDYTLTLIPPFNSNLNEAVYKVSVDGLIAMGINVEMEIVHSLNRMFIPFVTIDGYPSENMPSINIDDRKAAYDLMKEVLKNGHKKIAIVSLQESEFYKSNKYKRIKETRLSGFNDALKEYQMSIDDKNIILFAEECVYQSGIHVAEQLIKGNKDVTCIVCMSDTIAIGCISYLTQNSYNIPDDYSVVGFDNISMSSLIYPNLTTIEQPSVEKGELAAKTLFKVIEGAEIENENIILPHRLIKRKSLKNLNREQK